MDMATVGMKALALETQRQLELSTRPGAARGRDTDGRSFTSVAELWEVHGNRGVPADTHEDREQEAAWYMDAAAFWNDAKNCPASEDGVLGGFGHVSPIDVRESAGFLARLRKLRPVLGCDAALDCAAGIGRVAKHLLLPRFARVDLLEPSRRLLAASTEYVGSLGAKPPAGGCAGAAAATASVPAAAAEAPPARALGAIGSLTCCSMQQFYPVHAHCARWDVVWVQWAIGHLTDLDMIDFLQRCRAALHPGGVVCLKENVIAKDDDIAFEVDTEDSSLTRSLDYYRCIFRQSGLTVVLEEQQHAADWPSDLLPVYMWALA